MYAKQITRSSPALFVLLIDRSGSMREPVVFGGEQITRAEAVTRVVNPFISELVYRCQREEGVRDYIFLQAIGYGGDGVRPLLSSALKPVSVSSLAASAREVRHRLVERRLANGNTSVGRFAETVWIEPAAGGDTPMGQALGKAAGIVARWCADPAHAAGYPPVVINITDGEASDASPVELCSAAESIRGAATSDGATLLINIHITSTGAGCVAFPQDAGELPAAAGARLLYELSSDMPDAYLGAVLALRGGGAVPGKPLRGVSYNTPLTELVAMLGIGSVSVNLIG